MCTGETEPTQGSDSRGHSRARSGSREKPAVVAEVRRLAEASPELSGLIQTFEAGRPLLREGEYRDEVFCLLEGAVTLYKKAPTGGRIAVDSIRPGDLVGLLSYCTGNPNFVDAVVESPVTALTLSFERFGSLAESAPELYERLQTLIRDNLTERYRRMVVLHLKLATLNATLEKERDELRRTVLELERTRSRLVQQEKMAVLGSLVAGLAHEINNPASAVLRSVEYLREAFEDVLKQIPGEVEQGTARRFWESGMRAQLPDTVTQRSRLETLAREHPKLPRPLLRRLAAVPPEVLDLESGIETENVARLLPVFEAGLNLQIIQVSSERIRNLVVHLKKYARPGTQGRQRIDLRDGIRETLLILRAALKRFEVELDLPEIPGVYADPGRLNQVWTNLIYNACEAMGESGRLRIACGRAGPCRVFVDVRDSGPGVNEEIKEKIFQPNYTTKEQVNHFGLGLGLSISKDIVSDCNGELTVRNAPEGGAIFRVELPAAEGGGGEET